MAQRFPNIEQETDPSMTDGDSRASTLGSGLVVDIDRQAVRAVLFDTVGGHGRFISSSQRKSTLLPPVDDGFQAVKAAIGDLERDTGAQLLGSEGLEIPRDGQNGVDFVAVTGNIAEPVRLQFLPAGASDIVGPLVAAARRTASVVDILGRNVRTDDGVLSGTLVESEIRSFRPDVIVLLDGEHTQAEWATAIGTLSSLAAEGVIDLVIIVARDQYQQQAAQTMGENADLRGIDPHEFDAVDIAAAIESELHGLSEARFDVSSLVPATRRVSFTNRVRAGDLVTTFLARRRDQHVTAVSIGDGISIHAATQDSNLTANRLDIDAHANVAGMLKQDSRQVLGWLPVLVSEEELHHWILNRALRPDTVSHTVKDRLLEWAITTAALRTAWRDLVGNTTHHHDVVIGGGALGKWNSPALALLCLLNSLQPASSSGVVEVHLDQDGLLHAAGAIGDLSPALAADVVERDLLMPLASVIAVSSDGSEGDLAVRGEIQYESGDSEPFSVPVGSIHRLALDAESAAKITLHCEPNASAGSAAKGETVTFGEQVRLRGGALGVVIDARSRIDPGATDAQNQAARVSSWLSDLGETELNR